ncbi:MAG: HU family DNA-binding protein [Candidatus Pacebacteria bacterium]|nr:HU family DNA-binding protein [Candidatus Paceibacterota bacterium]
MAKAISKDALSDAIVKKTAVSKRVATDALNAIIDEITTTLAKGGQVTITGFGTFKVSKRAARTGRNPKTGEALKIPAMKVPKFKAGKSLKDAVK